MNLSWQLVTVVAILVVWKAMRWLNELEEEG